MRLPPSLPPSPPSLPRRRRARSYVSVEDMKFFYDAVDKGPVAIAFEDLAAQVADMVRPGAPDKGFTLRELRRCQLGHGVIGLLVNHNSMLVHRTTAEWQRGEFPL